MATATTEVPTLQIHRIGTQTLLVPIIGTTPLVINRFNEKKKRELLESMQGKKKPKEIKDPEAEYKDAFYHLKDGSYGFPALGFKAATVAGARFYGKDVSMKGLRQCIFFNGELGTDWMQLVRINGEPIMREDIVRQGVSGTNLRYRPQFTEWSATLEVVYVQAMLTADSVLSLIDAGGLGVGVGEWRPERGGDFGTYRIDPEGTVEVLS